MPPGAPDLFTFGKVMGGGFPAAAFGGRADVMALLAPVGPVYQAGTLSGNPVATAAGLATLRHCTPQVYDHLGEVADTLTAALADELGRAGVPHTIQRAGSMFSVFFRDGRGRTTTTPRGPSTSRPSRPSSTRCSSQGVYLPPSAFESWFVSAAHDDAGRRPGARRPARRGVGGGRRVCEDRRMTAAEGTATDRTVVHLMRHGEVHNPDGILYGRLRGLPALRPRAARWRRPSPATSPTTTSTLVVASSLQRAQETAKPVAAAHGLDVTTDDRRHRGGQPLRGRAGRRRCGLRLRPPAALAQVCQPAARRRGVRRTPTSRGGWRRPSRTPASRRGATRPSSSPTSCRSGPPATPSTRQRLWHDPRRRECRLASLTTLAYVGDELESITYSEPAAALLDRAAVGGTG